MIDERSVLLPIDMQRAFDGAPWPTRNNPDLDRNGLALLAAWRQAGFPIIHVQHDSVEPGSSLRPGSPGHDFRAGFEPRAGEPLIRKSVNAAFIGTDLDLQLRRLGATRVVAFGVSTDMCVSTSVRVGSNLGWKMLLIEDACAAFDLPDGRGGVISADAVHAAHVATLRYEFADVARAAEVIAALNRAPAEAETEARPS